MTRLLFFFLGFVLSAYVLPALLMRRRVLCDGGGLA